MKDVRSRTPAETPSDRGHEQPRSAVPPEARSRVAAARRWAIAHGRTLSTPALSVVLAAKASRPEPLDCWTSETVSELLWAGIVTWCQHRGESCPDRVAETMWTYLTFLAEEGALAGGSDGLTHLRAPLVAVGGLNRDGRERARGARPPSARHRPARSAARLAPVVPLRRTSPSA